jgi:hypothetical protein
METIFNLVDPEVLEEHQSYAIISFHLIMLLVIRLQFVMVVDIQLELIPKKLIPSFAMDLHPVSFILFFPNFYQMQVSRLIISPSKIIQVFL